MLAKENRLQRADDFRLTMRTGLKVSGQSMVIYLKRDSGFTQSRFGFVVAKSVGNAVVRNRVKRRLRELAHSSLSVVSSGSNLVVRALPASAELDWNKLSLDFELTLGKALKLEQK